MKPFTQIAIPHEDIVEGRLAMDVYAADLWQVANGKAPYRNPDLQKDISDLRPEKYIKHCKKKA